MRCLAKVITIAEWDMAALRMVKKRWAREGVNDLSLRHASHRIIKVARMHWRRRFRLGHACICNSGVDVIAASGMEALQL